MSPTLVLARISHGRHVLVSTENTDLGDFCALFSFGSLVHHTVFVTEHLELSQAAQSTVPVKAHGVTFTGSRYKTSHLSRILQAGVLCLALRFTQQKENYVDSSSAVLMEGRLTV